MKTILILCFAVISALSFGQTSKTKPPISNSESLLQQDTITFENGNYAIYYKNKNGLLHGQKLFYSKEKILLQSLSYINGKLNGPNIYYYKNGAIKQFWNYKNNQADGIVFLANSNGVIQWQGKYKNGQPADVRFFADSTGKPINGKDTVLLNKTSWAVSCNEGIPNGAFKQFNAKKQCIQEGFYKEGLLHGIRSIYDSDSNLTKKELFINGLFEGSIIIPNSRAVKKLDKIINLEPNNRYWRIERIHIYDKLGLRDSSMKDLQFLLDKDSTDTDVLYNIGVVCMKFNEYDKADEYLKKCILYAPNHCKALYNLGIVRFSFDQFIQAKDFFAKALLCNPDFEDAQTNLKILENINSHQNSTNKKELLITPIR